MNTSSNRRRQCLPAGWPSVLLACGLAPLMALFCSAVPSQTPTPTCNGSYVPAVIVPPDPTYVPGEPFTLRIEPASGDWPTTPTSGFWNYTHPTGGYPVFLGNDLAQEFVFPPPEFDELEIRAGAAGPGIRDDCPNWSTGVVTVTVRRFDYVPTPTPTPSPTPSPTPTCTPLPCSERFPYPPAWTEGNPLSFTMQAYDGAYFILMREDAYPYTEVPVEDLGNNRWRVEGLKPLTEYEIYYHCGVDCHDEVWNGFRYFTTGDGTPQGSMWILSVAPTPRKSSFKLSDSNEGGMP